jgi:hypothetical protein
MKRFLSNPWLRHPGRAFSYLAALALSSRMVASVAAAATDDIWSAVASAFCVAVLTWQAYPAVMYCLGKRSEVGVGYAGLDGQPRTNGIVGSLCFFVPPLSVYSVASLLSFLFVVRRRRAAAAARQDLVTAGGVVV